MKKRVGIFSFSCDEGCSIYLIEIFNKKLVGWLEKMELAYFLSVKTHNDLKDLDIALVEGVVSNEKELGEINKIRENAKIVIAMGSCAVTGAISAQRNNFSAKMQSEIQDNIEKFKMLPKSLTINQAVKVDDQILGCPILEDQFIKVFEKYL